MKKPSKEALARIPEAVRTFMNGMLPHLKGAAKHSLLELRAYEHLTANSKNWMHNLYGTYYGWQVTVQVISDEASARERMAKVCVHVYVRAHTDWRWEVLLTEPIRGLDEMIRAVGRLTEEAAVLCGLRLMRADAPNGLV